MTVNKLAISLTVIFAVSAVILATILFRRRGSRSSKPQPPINNQNPNYSTKDLLYFFCMKSQTRVEPSGSPTQNPDRDSENDTMIDVFKMLGATGGISRVLCTIKEEEREDVETVSLQACFESEVAEERAVKCDVEIFSPCGSPLFFTPIGSPTRDFVSPVTDER